MISALFLTFRCFHPSLQIEQLAERQDELLDKNKIVEVEKQRLHVEVKQSKNKVGLLHQQKEQLNERLVL